MSKKLIFQMKSPQKETPPPANVPAQKGGPPALNPTDAAQIAHDQASAVNATDENAAKAPLDLLSAYTNATDDATLAKALGSVEALGNVAQLAYNPKVAMSAVVALGEYLDVR
jgi:hypothetical protein